MKHLTKTFVLMLLVLPAGAVAEDPLGISAGGDGFEYVTSVEGIHEYSLPNGLQVLLFPDNAQARVTVNVTYRVGSMHENYGETGMAHLLEHLLFKGTPDNPDIPKSFNERGMGFNGTTWLDRTNYFESFEPTDDNLEWALRMEADRMVNSFIAYEDLQSEFSVVRNEMERGENSPGRMLDQRVRAAAFEWHNYGNSTIGARSDVEGVDIGRLQAFYRTYYQPDNATLIVAGDFDPREATAIIADSFGTIPAAERELPRIYTVEPVQDGERLVTLRRVGKQSLVMAAYHIPAGATKENTALDAVSRILADSSRGRLYRKMIEPGIAAGAGARADAFAFPGLFTLNATVPVDGDTQEVLDALLDVSEGVPAEPITEEELEWARLAMVSSYDKAIKNVGSLARILSESIAAGDWRYLFLYKDQLDALSVEDLNAAAAKHFKRSNRTAGMFIPTESPDRAAVASRSDQSEELASLAGRQSVSAGEEFVPSPDNIAARTVRQELAGGGSLWAIEKKSRGDRIIVSLNLFFGSEQSLAGKHGLAGYAAGQLQRGTTRYTRDELATEWDRLKSDLNLRGGGQRINASLQTDEANFEEALALMAHVLREPVFDPDQLEEAKRSALASIAGARGQPQSVVSISLSKALSPYPPDHFRYAMDLDEQEEMIRNMNRDALAEFWNSHIGYRGAIALAVGNFDTAALAGRLDELFGDWEAAVDYLPAPNRHHPVQAREEWLDTPDKANGFMVAALPVPLNVRDADYAPLVIGTRIFGGGGLSNRLINRLRQKEGWSYGAGGGMNASERSGDDSGALFIQAIAAPENLSKVRGGALEELQRVIDDGFTPEELQDAVDGAISGDLNSWSSDAALTGILSSGAEHGLDALWYGALHEQYRALTLDDVNETFRKYYAADDFLIFIGGDKARAEDTG
ncbi:MAG: insulinase family protein [Gammaproteobacteria bacterium]|nr:insulinase family protein [Gammaproteobacteria bacterium]MYD03090.1 insulinase family protein [Gammaproteobacteria bacterium]MYI25713.1 insulinase family protein [Gammaproteobacteria bacterium]